MSISSAKFHLFLHPPSSALPAHLREEMSGVCAGLSCHCSQQDSPFIDGDSGGQSATKYFCQRPHCWVSGFQPELEY